MAQNSLTVWDDEAQALLGPKNETNVWGDQLNQIAYRKGMPRTANHFTRRNDSNTGTLYEWDNA